MTFNQNEELSIDTPNGKFDIIYRCDSQIPIYDEVGNIIDWNLVGYEVVMTAEEWYAKWLHDKENPQPPTPDKNTILFEEQLSLLQQELILSNQYITDLELRLLEISQTARGDVK